MKKFFRGKRNTIFLTLLIVLFAGLFILRYVPALIARNLLESVTTEATEYDKSKDPLTLGRPENAEELPDLSKDISSIRMTVVSRPYTPPSLLAGNYEKIELLQIWYGYQEGNTWYDHPSENYNLIGIYENEEPSGWKAADGSHLTKIGPYVLINFYLPADPNIECSIKDTLNTQIQEPFEKYYTFDAYVDDNGKEHRYLDSHSIGYGYLCEDPAEINNPKDSPCVMWPEFYRRYYLVLNYDEITDDYQIEVKLNREVLGYPDSYRLSGEQIKAVLE